jgi:hypothetical protein
LDALSLWNNSFAEADLFKKSGLPSHYPSQFHDIAFTSDVLGVQNVQKEWPDPPQPKLIKIA